MQAITLDAFGGPDVLRLREVDDPLVGPDFVLIETRAAGVNPVDTKIREGRLTGAFPHFFPLIPGWDAAGVVRAVGPAVTRLEPGDEVYAYCRKDFVRDGTYAERVSMRERAVAHKPRGLTFSDAGGAPLAALTALQMLDAAGVQAGEEVIVQAAAGGVGHFAVQLARARGARVTAIAGSGNQDFVRELGAERPVDYGAGDLTELLSDALPGGAAVALDIFGGDFPAQVAPVLAERQGRIVSIAAPPDPGALGERGVGAQYVFVRPDAPGLHALARHFADGVRGHVSERLPLADAARAHELVEDGHVRGKLVLEP